MQKLSFGQRLVASSRSVLLLTGLLSLLAVFLVLDFSASGVGSRVRIDPTVDRLLDPDSPARAFQKYTAELFGAEEVAVLAVGGREWRSTNGLQALRSIHKTLARRSEIQRVDSLATAVSSSLDEDGFVVVEPFAELPAGSPQQVSALEDALTSNPLVNGLLLSKDGQVAAFVLHFRDDPAELFADAGYVGALKASVKDLAPDLPVFITGTEVVKAGVARTVAQQLVVLIPLVLVLTGLITVVAFRSVKGAALTLLTVGTGLLWTLAVVVVLDTPLTLVSAIMPPVVITLGLAYAMHTQSDYLARLRRRDDCGCDVVVAETIDSLRLPLLLTGATTVAGFLALLLNPLQAVREFAAFSALGVTIDIFLALCVLPLLLGATHCTPARFDGSEFFDRWAERFSAFALRHRRGILVAGSAVLVLGAISLVQVKVGTNYVRSFAPDHPVRVDFEEINSALSGVNGFSIVLEGFVEDTFTEPEVLRAMERLQAWLALQPEVGASQSILDYLQLIRLGFGENVNGAGQVPDSAQEIKQLLLFGASPAMNAVVDKRFATARILVRSYEENSAAIRSLLDRLQPQLDKMPRRLEVTVTGDSVTLTETVTNIASGQWLTVGVAAIMIYLVLAALFTSWRVAALAMLPNLMPVAVYYGLLGLFDISLNPTTSLIACIVLGVAVDDTIHFLVRFNNASRQLADESKAVAVALRGVLRPVTFTTVALCTGFGLMALSPLQNQVQFGLLASATLAIAWLFDVIFTPALGSGVRLVTLWDVIRLDLGADPEKSIPLFAGLSARQARTFALMTRVQDFAQGQRVITQGQDAEDIYVVIDGRLRAFLDREDGQRELAIMERGAVMGEVGYFGQKRTANVETQTPARLLAFNGADLDAMRRRYPRIAATIYRNMNLAQAERLANMSKMI